MRLLLVIFFTSSLFLIANAQGKRWKPYFSENSDSLYDTSYCYVSTTANYRYRTFTNYPNFYQTVHEVDNEEMINRVGLILNAKSIKRYYFNCEAIHGNEQDSLRIWYQVAADVIRNGRSALFSLMNLFSKAEDREPQDEPSYTASKQVKKGFIEFDGEQMLFEADTLYLGTHKIILTKIKRVIHSKTGKIKKTKRNGLGQRLMKGDSCLAVLDYTKWPTTLYFLKSLDEKDRIIYTAFIRINDLTFLNMEEKYEQDY